MNRICWSFTNGNHRPFIHSFTGRGSFADNFIENQWPKDDDCDWDRAIRIN